MTWKSDVDEIARRQARAKLQGGATSIERHHAKGKLTVRERIDVLLDKDTFDEVGAAAGASEEAGNSNAPPEFTPANFVLGFGKINGRRCIVGGEDFTLKGGSPSSAGLRKSVYTEQLALKYRVPLVRLHEGAGGSVGSAAKSLSAPVYDAPRFRSVAQTLATVPVASAAMGSVAGLPAARLVSSHFSVMSRDTAQVLIAGPAVVQRALGEEVTKEELGGADVHGRNGTVDNVADDERAALAEIRTFLSYLPQNVSELSAPTPCDDPADRRDEALLNIIPRERRQVFDMRRLLRSVLDQETFFEFGKGYGRGQITGFARLMGHAVGVWANDSRQLAGSMTADGAQKARRFIELCDTFRLPIVSFVDEPGFMIGSKAEHASTIRHGSATVLTAAMSRVPWAAIMVRRSFGVAQIAHYGNEPYVLAWPSAETGPLPVEGGVAIAFHREIAAADDPDAKRRELEEQLAAGRSPFPRAEAFSMHELIDPRETRPMLARWVDRVLPLLDHCGPTAFSYRP